LLSSLPSNALNLSPVPWLAAAGTQSSVDRRMTTVTNRASEPASKAITSATSAGLAARPIGMRRRNSATSSGGMSAVASVEVSDGAARLPALPPQ
jgi:hypothetical protein